MLFRSGALWGLTQIDMPISSFPLNLLVSLITALFLIIVGTRTALRGRDTICDLRRHLRMHRLRSGESWHEVEALIADIGPLLAAALPTDDGD